MSYKEFKKVATGVGVDLTDQEVRALFVLCHELKQWSGQPIGDTLDVLNRFDA